MEATRDTRVGHFGDVVSPGRAPQVRSL